MARRLRARRVGEPRLEPRSSPSGWASGRGRGSRDDEAELLHDTLDEIIEANGTPEVVTTWIEDPAEASEYFLHAAAGRRANLLALIDAHPELRAALEDGIHR